MAETPKEFDRTTAEYIDRRQIRYTWWQKQDGTFTDGVTLESIIDAMPTADVVPVVRCGECEHFKEYPIIDTSIPSGWGKCTKINMDVDLTINDYCSYGERR